MTGRSGGRAASPRTDYDKDKQGSSDKHEGKATGLDNADQKAGEHGQHGRDNAREKQSR